MRAKFIEGNKPEKYIHVVRNIDVGSVSSVTTVSNSIPAGTPLVLNLGPTLNPSTYQNGLPAGFEDGMDVVLPVSAANNALAGQLGATYIMNYFHYGIAVSNIGYNQLGESMVHGVYPYALMTRATRAASTNSWSSSASVAASIAFLSIDTINNAYTTYASAAAATTNATLPATNVLPVYLLDNIASISASATNTSDTRTAIITQQRVFIREM